jgi:hypothetical protein
VCRCPSRPFRATRRAGNLRPAVNYKRAISFENDYLLLHPNYKQLIWLRHKCTKRIFAAIFGNSVPIAALNHWRSSSSNVINETGVPQMKDANLQCHRIFSLFLSMI